MTKLSAQLFLDLAFHQDEEANSNEEPCPDTGIETIGFAGRRSKGIPCDKAQQQRHAPRQPNENDGS